MCHVLIIEDEALVSLNIQLLLGEHGATSFDIAETEAEAIDAAVIRRPDFITSDVRLKTGTGPGAILAINEFFGLLPVIFITASPECCERFGPAVRVFSKPLNEPLIAQAFRDLAPV